jgi:hypothetical protein
MISVPEGHLRIARRFNGGTKKRPQLFSSVPEGRLKIAQAPILSRPSGTERVGFDVLSPRTKVLGYFQSSVPDEASQDAAESRTAI